MDVEAPLLPQTQAQTEETVEPTEHAEKSVSEQPEKPVFEKPKTKIFLSFSIFSNFFKVRFYR